MWLPNTQPSIIEFNQMRLKLLQYLIPGRIQISYKRILNNIWYLDNLIRSWFQKTTSPFGYSSLGGELLLFEYVVFRGYISVKRSPYSFLAAMTMNSYFSKKYNLVEHLHNNFSGFRDSKSAERSLQSQRHWLERSPHNVHRGHCLFPRINSSSSPEIH